MAGSDLLANCYFSSIKLAVDNEIGRYGMNEAGSTGLIIDLYWHYMAGKE